jgi:predicted DNA-binding transcriptional regulator AlpA
MATSLKHHLDKRTASLIEAGRDGADDDLLSTREVAHWLGVSTQWIEIGRSKGYGPSFVRISPRRIRYRRGAVIEFLSGRQHACTREYTKKPSPA